MRHAIDFLDMMVRDVLDFDVNRLHVAGIEDVSIKLFPAAPARAMHEILHRVNSMFMYKYSGMKSVVLSDQRITLDNSLKKVHIELCYGIADVRGSTCAGAMVDSHRFLTADTNSALFNSMVTMRSLGFIAHTVTMPLDF